MTAPGEAQSATGEAPSQAPSQAPKVYVFVRSYPSSAASGRVRQRLLDASRLQPAYRFPDPSDGPHASLLLSHFSGAGDLFVAPADGEAGDDPATRTLREAWDLLPIVALYHSAPWTHPDLDPGDLRVLEAIMDAEPGAEPVTPTPRLVDWLRDRLARRPAKWTYFVAVRLAAEPTPPASPPPAVAGPF